MAKIPYNKSELEVVGYYPDAFRGKVARLNTPITPRENFFMMIRGEKPCWIPSGSDNVNISPSIILDNNARGFVHEAGEYNPDEVAGGPDMFGVEWEWVPTVHGSMVRPGAPKVPDITEWENYITFPDIESWDWEASVEKNKEILAEKSTRVIGLTLLNGLFERLISFIDMNEAMISMVDEDAQEGVHRLFDKLADLYAGLIAKFKKYYDIDLITFHDDWGSQRAPFFSLETCREMLVPYLKRVADAAHANGILFELHSCGKNELLVPAMIEAGVDMWNGQPMNDKKMLCEMYGDKIILGAAPVTLTAESTEEEVRKTYEEFMETFKDYRIYGGVAMGVPGTREICYECSRLAYLAD